ncbi:MAG: hypothetical protein KC933_34295 [Myxococcales bacterium]|nr:hypothetical protein [Myxococcales bacterium]MCB9645848.1 hypothetical protein [Deltaproteobacteria bacterium]
MRPPTKREDASPGMSSAQLEITKSVIAASAEITAAMVTVTNEKNPAKISEAYRVIYKTIMETVRGPSKKPTT